MPWSLVPVQPCGAFSHFSVCVPISHKPSVKHIEWGFFHDYLIGKERKHVGIKLNLLGGKNILVLDSYHLGTLDPTVLGSDAI